MIRFVPRFTTRCLRLLMLLLAAAGLCGTSVVLGASPAGANPVTVHGAPSIHLCPRGPSRPGTSGVIPGCCNGTGATTTACCFGVATTVPCCHPVAPASGTDTPSTKTLCCFPILGATATRSCCGPTPATSGTPALHCCGAVPATAVVCCGPPPATSGTPALHCCGAEPATAVVCCGPTAIACPIPQVTIKGRVSVTGLPAITCKKGQLCIRPVYRFKVSATLTTAPKTVVSTVAFANGPYALHTAPGTFDISASADPFPLGIASPLKQPPAAKFSCSAAQATVTVPAKPTKAIVDNITCKAA